MGYKMFFMDNEVYTAQDVNDVLSNITTEGVVIGNSGNVLTDLNDAVGEIATEGVTQGYDNCRVIYTNGVYKINQGTCFMADGSSIIFDEHGYEITPIENTYTYVYLKRNQTENSIDIIVSDIEGNAESIPLCEINENGEILDRRKYSKAKVQLTSGGFIGDFSYDFKLSSIQTATIDIGIGDFSHICFNELKPIGGSVTLYPRYENLWEITDAETITVYFGRNHNTTDAILCFKKNGQYIEISAGNNMSYGTYNIKFSLI